MCSVKAVLGATHAVSAAAAVPEQGPPRSSTQESPAPPTKGPATEYSAAQQRLPATLAKLCAAKQLLP